MRSLFAAVVSLAAVVAAPVHAAVVQGKVVEAGTNTPLAGATVSVVAPGFFFLPVVVASAQTGADGRYTIDTDAIANPVAIVTTAPGFAGRSHVGERCPAEPIFCYQAATKVTLSNAAPLTADVALGHAARIRGTLRDRATGAPPAPDAYIQIRHVGSPALMHLAATSTAAADGSFEFGDLHGGTYEFRASASVANVSDRRYLSYAWPDLHCDGVQVSCDTLATQPLVVADGALLDDVDAELRTGAYVRVRMISDGNGSWIQHSAVASAPADASHRIDGFIEADGYSATGPLLPGAINLHVRPYATLAYPAKIYPNLPCNTDPCDLSGAPTIDVAAGATVTLNDIHVAPLRTASGRVTDQATGLPIANATVAAGALVPPTFGLWGFVAEATAQTDADGRYVLEGFGSEDVALVTRQAGSGWIDRGWSDVECSGANRFCNDAATPFTLLDFFAQPHPAGIDFAIARGATLSGRVVFAGSGAPAANYAVAAVPASHGLAGKPVFTDAQGNFSVGGLTPESYFLFASPHAAFANSPGTIWPSLPCSVLWIDSPIDCAPTASHRLTPAAGGSIGDLTIVVPDLDAIFGDGFEP
ncbi:MAG TPA: carboxypeptidase regulatory-like domain-containing protein [Tahibacter sp.]|uniref:carboxypeptidase regulatory-like domain-containing protein n=1 Tax=Tahibacter sp. TaxID=2056211 RepID=UPI002BF7E554|nr:carboxypeptidase regulatory-like domain-containing protein [Tahibacter sp.]HSX59919.1 carboxypeptidase regulatory-like domain-containing protein [Tahibacter sp.]